MALIDNLIVKIQPASGDTFVKNLIDNTNVAANGAGTLTLVDDAGLQGWNVQGERTGAFSGGAAYEGGAITVALRFKANTRLFDYNQYLAVGTAESGSSYGARVSNAGSNTGSIRLSEMLAGAGMAIFATTEYTTGQYFTAVMRICDTTFTPGTLAGFLKQASRVSNSPDYSIASTAASRDALGVIDSMVFGSTGQNLTFVDIAVWRRALSDEESAQVADDIRGALSVPSVMIAGTIGNADAAGLTASVTLAGTTTINGIVGNAAADGLTASITTGGTTTITSTIGNASAEGSAASVLSLIMSSPLTNNTESILAGQAVVWTWTPAGRIGSMAGLTATDGAGTTDANGRLLTSIAVAAGRLDVAKRNASALVDDVYYEAFA